MRGRIGYVPEDAPLYDGMRVAEFLRFMAVIKGVSRSGVEAAVDRAAASLQLGRVLRVPIGKLSRGYRQRVAIAQALLNDPAVLLLDEPTNALDAYQVIAIRELVRSFAGKRTVLVASHVLSEIEKMADRVMIMLEGELLTENAAAAATRQRRYRLRVGGSPAAVLAAIGAVPSVTAASLLAEEPRAPAYLVETAAEPGVAGALVAALVAAGLAFEELSELRPDLEQVFLDLTRSRRLEAAA
jgi:ABC-2 type transport system ATP-binding protein